MVEAFNFGASGDGVTDDSAALEHALTAGDGVLRLHKGSFRLTRPLVIDLAKTGYAAVIGDGGASRLVMAGAGPAIKVVGTHRGTSMPKSVTDITWQKERFPTLSGFEILGEHPEAVGIELVRTIQPTVSQVLVRRCRYGIHLTERNRNVLITDCHLYDNELYGLFMDRCDLHQTNVTGCHISFNKRAGIKSLGGDVHNLQITGNDIEYNNRPGVDTADEGGAEVDFDAVEGTISEVTLSSNTIQATVQPGGANVRIRGSESGKTQGACLIAITGNVLGSNTRGLDLAHVYRMTVTGNTIYDGGEYSILARSCRGLAIGSNTICWKADEKLPARDGLLFEDCEQVALIGLTAERLCSGSDNAGAGIMFHGCRDIQVSGCQIVDPLFAGLELRGCVRCVLTANSIVDRRDIPRMKHAIRLAGQNRDVMIQHNLLRGAIESAITGPREGVFVRN
ncbi:MAG: right-handed parallel beta-helix repeat-containing protein [Planctomycetes bacterium]|nr:right-handed parallel beta-helix repeat-containing protein [Planctomycetota bacterium]